MHWVGRIRSGAVIVGDRHALAVSIGMASKLSIKGTHNGKAAELLPLVDESFKASTRVSLVAPKKVAAAMLRCDSAVYDLGARVQARRKNGGTLTETEHKSLMEKTNSLGIRFETISARSLWGRKIGRQLPKEPRS